MEFLGLWFRQGRLDTQKAKKALDHDFPSAALGVIDPRGVYDVTRNLGHRNLGPSRDTSRFACDRLGFSTRSARARHIDQLRQEPQIANYHQVRTRIR
jgi:hypothetical protein